MAVGLNGHRIGKTGEVAVGCTSVILDPTRTKLLLIQRSDNGQWALPGGFLESGESVSEACEREAHEETGLLVRAKKLVGVYADPNHVTEYPDGRRFYFVTLCIECEIVGGELTENNAEVLRSGYFSRNTLIEMDIIEAQRQQIEDAFIDRETCIIR